MSTATPLNSKAQEPACGAAALGRDPQAEALEQSLIKRLRNRDGRTGKSPDAPMVGSLQSRFGFAARSFDELGIVGTPRISSFANDSFASSCGRFMVIARDLYAENQTPMRLRSPGVDTYRQELWADGKLVAKTANGNFAVNWLMMKVKGAGFLDEALLKQSAASLPDMQAPPVLDDVCDEPTFDRPRG